MFCYYVHKSSEKCYFFFAKKNVHGLLHFASINYKALQFFQWWWEKKSKERAQKKKNVDSRKKGYFTRATTTSSSCRQMSFFFGQSTKGIFGCTSESFVCKKDWVENASSSYQPFPSFQWFEPLNVFLTFFFGKNMSNATASTASLTPIIKHYFCSCCKHENLSLSVSNYQKLLNTIHFEENLDAVSLKVS